MDLSSVDLSPIEAPGAQTIGMVFLGAMASFIGLFMLCDIPSMIIHARKHCCKNLAYIYHKPRPYSRVKVAATPEPRERPDLVANNRKEGMKGSGGAD